MDAARNLNFPIVQTRMKQQKRLCPLSVSGATVFVGSCPRHVGMLYRTALCLLPVFTAGLNEKIKAQGPMSKPAAVHPNVVYILTDEWRAQATGYAGDPNVKTPNLDLLSKKSINFKNAVSVLPVCTPHRAALLTGRYPQSTGMIFNDLYLPARELTMGEMYKAAGYNTAYIGKWHLDGHGRLSYIPQERRQGFDYWKAAECTHNYNRSKYFDNNDTAATYWPGYDVYAQTTDAKKYIATQAKSDKPFLMVLAYGAPHFPHEGAPENLKRLYSAASIKLRPNVPDSLAGEARREAVGYYAHCTAIDSCIGELQKAIQAAGIESNTLFVFTSDHGEMLGSQGVPPEAKQRLWDESIEVPFLLYYPALGKQTTQTINYPINTPDILPTLLGLCNLSRPATIEGEDLSHFLTGKKMMSDRAALFMNLSPFTENFGGDEFRGIRTSRYTYVRNLKGPWMFFDNETDPYQLHNLIGDAKHKTLQAQLDAQLMRMLNQRGDGFEPREYYIKKWGYKLRKNKGEIPYGPGPYEAQSPSSEK